MSTNISEVIKGRSVVFRMFLEEINVSYFLREKSPGDDSGAKKKKKKHRKKKDKSGGKETPQDPLAKVCVRACVCAHVSVLGLCCYPDWVFP